MDMNTVERPVWIAASREQVWAAITDPAQLTKWYAPGCPWQIPTLEVGETVKFYNTETDILVATIDEVDKPHRFALRWQPDETYPAAVVTTTFILEEVNSGTRATIMESGFEALPETIRQERIDQTIGAYDFSMENLKAYLEGRDVPA